jgi:hypothetical protein
MTRLEYLSIVYFIKQLCENKDLEGIEKVVDKIIREAEIEKKSKD